MSEDPKSQQLQIHPMRLKLRYKLACIERMRSLLPHRSSAVREPSSDSWQETVDEWGQVSWKNKRTNEVSWQKPPGHNDSQAEESNDILEAGDTGNQQDKGETAWKSDTRIKGSRTKTAPDGYSSSSDEEVPTSFHDAAFFSKRQERRIIRLERKKNAATIAARRVLTFLEETVSMYHEHRQLPSLSDEDDTPAFIDLQSLRNLAAGKTGWKYVPKKSRKAAKTRVDVIDIAKTRDPGLAREVQNALAPAERESTAILNTSGNFVGKQKPFIVDANTLLRATTTLGTDESDGDGISPEQLRGQLEAIVRLGVFFF
jgi:hypothetical protein